MAKTIVVQGATYHDVPALEMLQPGGEPCLFYDAEDGDNLYYGDETTALVGAGKVGYMVIEGSLE